MPQLSVIVPTYCEADNLPVLVRRVFQAVELAGISTELIVVDDASPDATEAVCAELARRHPVRLIRRENERGLSTAVIAGMDAARGEIVLCMDADLSHPPERIPDMVAALRRPGVRFVVGSRYVPGASVAGDWGAHRVWNSRVATWLARPLTAVSDPMAGFFALPRSAFNEMRSRLDPVGYKIGLELLVKGGVERSVERGGGRVAEVPIDFADRLHGESKLSAKQQWDYLRHLGRLLDFRYPWASGLARFLAVGLTGMAVDLTTFAALLASDRVPVAAARAAAIAVALTWNFLLNRRFTFRRHRERESVLRQYVGFCAACLVGMGVNMAVSLGLGAVDPFFVRHRLAAASLGIVAGALWNYTLCRRFVFGQRSPGEHSSGERSAGKTTAGHPQNDAHDDRSPAAPAGPRQRKSAA
jgi:dolichol-phosphate mannosyltransferase